MVEQRPFKALVVGSSPTQPTFSKASKTEAYERKTQFKFWGLRVYAKGVYAVYVRSTSKFGEGCVVS